MAGMCAVALELHAEAEDRFRRMLAIDPAATLTEGVAPKIQARLEAARRFVAERGALRVVLDGGALVIASDPLGMVMGARAWVGGRVVDLPGNERIALPAGATRVAAIDEHGNRLVDLVPPPPERSSAPRRSGRAGSSGAGSARRAWSRRRSSGSAARTRSTSSTRSRPTAAPTSSPTPNGWANEPSATPRSPTSASWWPAWARRWRSG
jgi:hypothetical protein